jgi:carbonic anhydrase
VDNYYKKLFENNKKWVSKMLDEDINYFKNLSKGQNPPLLWIGCSDSRVPASQIIGTQPGEVFVHRNIANMVIHTDISMLSVLDYAVNILKVNHVIVCGHYNCGGIEAALSNKHFGLLDNWIRQIKDVYRFHYDELNKLKNKDLHNRYVELNVIDQVHDLSKTSVIQKAWRNDQYIHLHGWVYDIADGIVRDLKVTLKDNKDVEDIYQLEFHNE